MLDTSESAKRASLRRWRVVVDPFAGVLLAVASALLLPFCSDSFTSAVVLRMLPPLRERFMSWLSALSGGLGGTRIGNGPTPLPPLAAAGVEFRLLALLSFPTSVASGVANASRLVFPATSSKLPTASRLCALLKPGYDVLGLPSATLPPRSIAGTPEDEYETGALLFLAAVEDRGDSLPPSPPRSRLLELRLRCTGLSELIFLAEDDVGSFSRSWSFLRRRGASSSRGDEGCRGIFNDPGTAGEHLALQCCCYGLLEIRSSLA